MQQLQKIRTKRITFVGKLQRALESGNFTNVFNGPIQNVSSFQLAKVSKQATCLLLYYKMSVEGPPKLKTFLYSEVSKQMPFSISAKTVSRWVSDFECNEGKFSESEQGRFTQKRILNESDLKNKCIHM